MDFGFSDINPTSEEYELFDLELEDEKLQRMLVQSLNKNVNHWNSAPYELERTDNDNVRYLLGDQLDRRFLRKDETPYLDNRMFTATRAVLAYVNARVATPEVAPSSNDKKMIQFAHDLKGAMYQHGVDNNLNRKAKAATKNLVVRKRGFLKQRFDPNAGPFGDIVVENIDPAEIIVDRFATYLGDPNIIYHRQWCSIEELCAKFPDMKDSIYKSFGFKRGVYTQISRRVAHYETWFTYYDDEHIRRQGLAWFLPENRLIMGKMKNPNWIYTGNDIQDRLVNFTTEPIKPFTVFNYLNNGKSYIDETSLFDQARPQQDLVNKRGKQILENADYVNGRWVANADVMDEEDAKKFINKNPKTIGLVPAGDRPISEVITVEDTPALPNYVVETLYDGRNEIDQIMGTPNIFRGQSQKDANTLGENVLIKEQAGALQDDLATSVDEAMTDYYRKLAQMMKVNYTEDHWFQVKGEDGKFDHVVMSGQLMDGNAKISVEAGSTLPANKQEMRNTVIEAAKQNRIDNLSFWEGIQYNKLPDPETIVERLMKEQNDPLAYMADVEQEAFNRDADIDLTLLVANKVPQERDEYPQGYLEHFNKYIMGNAFNKLPDDAKQRILEFLKSVLEIAMRTSSLQDTQVDDAQMSGQTEAEVLEQEQMI